MSEDARVSEEEREQLLQMAQLMHNSTLIKSYEQIMQQYEQENERKSGFLRDMERELQQIQVENASLAQQLYRLKTEATPEAPGFD